MGETCGYSSRTNLYVYVLYYQIPRKIEWGIAWSECINSLVFNNFVKMKKININLSHDVSSGSDITPCTKIDKPPVVYRFSSIT